MISNSLTHVAKTTSRNFGTLFFLRIFLFLPGNVDVVEGANSGFGLVSVASFSTRICSRARLFVFRNTPIKNA
jgi:hypothetical protein